MSEQVINICVSDEDVDLLKIKIGHSSGYARTTIKPQRYIHSIVAERMGFCWDKKTQVIDHVNRNKLDNRRDNLRIISRSINAINSLRSENARGYCRIPSGWRINITRGGVIHQNVFKTEQLAKEFVEKLRNKYNEF